MTKRRFAKRKQSSGLTFKAVAVIFGVLIAVAVFTPVVGKIIDETRLTARVLTLNAGFVDPATCVVTGTYAIDCADHAVGMPLREALSKMQSHEAELAAERSLRAEAESVARQAAAEIEQLRASGATSMMGSTQQQANRVLPSTAAGGGDVVPTTVARTKPSEAEALPVTVIPVQDGEEDRSYFPAEQGEAQ